MHSHKNPIFNFNRDFEIENDDMFANDDFSLLFPPDEDDLEDALEDDFNIYPD